jgi:malate synthase
MSSLKSTASLIVLPSGVDVRAPLVPGDEAILTPDALAFVAALERAFRAEREACLFARAERQARLDSGERPGFLAWTRSIREAEWVVAPAPPDLRDRRVEITGPTDRRMIINALNSGARVFMADFEDSNAPTWRNLLDGQKNLSDAVRRTITFVAEGGRKYELGEKTATLMVRPRGWHLCEAHVLVDGRPMSAALFDFGLFFFHNAREAMARGSGPYFYLPKLESHREARLWNEVFRAAQDRLGIARGTIRATVLIETVLAAFEMDEILWELREHSAGLNCGRWDYIFSFIKKLRCNAHAVLPDRSQVTMDQGFLRAYSQLLVKTCHRRGAHAIGGMAAQVPNKSDPERNRAALEKVRADKAREARDGHDGTWVAHPGLVGTAKAEFDAVMPGLNQISRKTPDVVVLADDLLRAPKGAITEAGIRVNVSVGVRYLESWLQGVGCVALDGLMEDAATAEISRAQLWQWIRHRARLPGDRVIDLALVRKILGEEVEAIRATLGAERFAAGRFDDAVRLFESLVAAPDFPEFLTLPAYELIVSPRPPVQEISL